MSEEILKNNGVLPTAQPNTRKPGAKSRITARMLKQVEQHEELGKTTPVMYWMAILNDDPRLELEQLRPKDYHSVKMKASENLAKFIYDASYDTEEVQALKLAPDQIEALKKAFPRFEKK